MSSQVHPKFLAKRYLRLFSPEGFHRYIREEIVAPKGKGSNYVLSQHLRIKFNFILYPKTTLSIQEIIVQHPVLYRNFWIIFESVYSFFKGIQLYSIYFADKLCTSVKQVFSSFSCQILFVLFCFFRTDFFSEFRIFLLLIPLNYLSCFKEMLLLISKFFFQEIRNNSRITN